MLKSLKVEASAGWFFKVAKQLKDLKHLRGRLPSHQFSFRHRSQNLWTFGRFTVQNCQNLRRLGPNNYNLSRNFPKLILLMSWIGVLPPGSCGRLAAVPRFAAPAPVPLPSVVDSTVSAIGAPEFHCAPSGRLEFSATFSTRIGQLDWTPAGC